MATSNGVVVGKVVQVAGPAVDCEFPEGQIPLIYTAIRITSEGFDTLDPIDIICEVEQHIGEGRVLNGIGEPGDEMGPVNAKKRYPIHRPAPSFEEQSTRLEMFETGIKVIDLIEPYLRGGTI